MGCEKQIFFTSPLLDAEKGRSQHCCTARRCMMTHPHASLFRGSCVIPGIYLQELEETQNELVEAHKVAVGADKCPVPGAHPCVLLGTLLQMQGGGALQSGL